MDSLTRNLTMALTAATLLGAGACGPGGDDDGGACADILPGELVITEVFADSSGEDEGKEWFEIYNASGAPIDLAGLTVLHSRPDGTSDDSHVIETTTIGAGEYLVLGNVLPEFVAGHLDYGYGGDLGDLFNSDSGRLRISCGDEIIDEALYESASARSTGFDGGAAPDYTANDDLTAWCNPPQEVAYEFETGNFGTPGSTNFDCVVVVAGQCDDNGTMRPVVAPVAGDVVITEVHPRPQAVAATMGEWFEVRATTSVDLNGLGIGRIGDTTPQIIDSASCLRVEAGSYAVFARNTDMLTNGGLPAVLAEMSLGLTDSNGDVEISIGATVLDSYAWPSARQGDSIQLDADVIDATGNDDAGSWCDSTAPYGSGDLGTPGLANAQCGGSVGGMCNDQTSGTPRDIVEPTDTQLTITEWMPNPALVDDSTGEWFEVRASAAVDLNGLQAGVAALGATPILPASGTCVHLEPGQYALFARNATAGIVAGTNGIPDQTVTGTFTFGLVNGASTLRVGVGGTELSTVTWAASTSGSSIQIDTDGTQCNSATTTTPTTQYNGSDRGTPKLVHEQECP